MFVGGMGCLQTQERGDADPESGGRRETQGEEVTQTLSRGRQASQWGLGQATPPSRGAQGPGSPQQGAGFLLEM